MRLSGVSQTAHGIYCGSRLRNALVFNVLQKAVFLSAKDTLLPAKRRPFATRNTAFDNAKNGLRPYNRPLTARQAANILLVRSIVLKLRTFSNRTFLKHSKGENDYHLMLNLQNDNNLT